MDILKQQIQDELKAPLLPVVNGQQHYVKLGHKSIEERLRYIDDEIFDRAIENHLMPRIPSGVMMDRKDILSRISLWNLWEDKLDAALAMIDKQSKKILSKLVAPDVTKMILNDYHAHQSVIKLFDSPEAGLMFVFDFESELNIDKIITDHLEKKQVAICQNCESSSTTTATTTSTGSKESKYGEQTPQVTSSQSSTPSSSSQVDGETNDEKKEDVPPKPKTQTSSKKSSTTKPKVDLPNIRQTSSLPFWTPIEFGGFAIPPWRFLDPKFPLVWTPKRKAVFREAHHPKFILGKQAGVFMILQPYDQDEILASKTATSLSI